MLFSLIAAVQCKVGVVFATHGGFEEYSDQNVWDNAIQLASYDKNSFVYQAIWNPQFWPILLSVPVARKNIGKYKFEYEKIKGRDPFTEITKWQKDQLSKQLSKFNVQVEMAQWLANGKDIENLAFPRFIYGLDDKPQKSNYCAPSWSECVKLRYDIDGPFERLAKQGIDTIYMIDMTVGGVRFSKTFDIYQMGKKAIAEFNRKNNRNVTLSWINDPENLLERSYPSQPNWTASLGKTSSDVIIPMTPNPIAEDAELARIMAKGIISAETSVEHGKTGVLLLNHPIFDWNECFDPKIDDTLAINKNIEKHLVSLGYNADLILGGWMGVFQNTSRFMEPTREMRAEDLGQAYMYQTTDKKLPAGKWGLRYWDALQRLKNEGAEHIIIGFPQIVVDSVLNLVELHNQIAKEIGTKTWVPTKANPASNYKDNSPFAEYWGNWVNVSNIDRQALKLGSKSYPPSRQTPITKRLDDFDPSLVFDVSAYGLLGYKNSSKIDAMKPVDNQYTGTWSMFDPVNKDPEMIDFLLKHVKLALEKAA